MRQEEIVEAGGERERSRGVYSGGWEWERKTDCGRPSRPLPSSTIIATDAGRTQ